MKKIYRILSISGYSGSGKTTLICKMIEEFNKRGIRTGTIKHSHHSIDLYDDKKDTGKHRSSGSEITCAVSENSASICINGNISEYFLDILRIYKNMDLIIVEGMSNSNLRGIEVLSYQDFVNHRIRKHINPDIYFVVCDKKNKSMSKYKNVVYSYEDIGRVCDIVEDGIKNGIYDIDYEKLNSYIEI